MSDLHDLQARAGDLERAISGTDDQHRGLLSGLERGLSQLRERLIGATAANDRLVRENAELKAITMQLLGALENKPAEKTLHDKLAALDGQLHGLLQLSGVQVSANGTPVNGTPVNGTPVAADHDGGTPEAVPEAAPEAAPEAVPEAAPEAAPEAVPEAVPESGGDAAGPFEEIRERMRALSSQLLAPAAPSAVPLAEVRAATVRAATAQATTVQAATAQAAVAETTAAQATTVQETAVQETAAEAQGSALVQTPAPARPPAVGAPPKPAPKRHARRNPGSPRAFDRPIKALAAKAQNVLPKARLRFEAETNYALSILRRMRGGRQPFSIEEVRELINGKFGLSLTARDDAQLSASLVNQADVTRGARGSRGATSWRFEMG